MSCTWTEYTFDILCATSATATAAKMTKAIAEKLAAVTGGTLTVTTNTSTSYIAQLRLKSTDNLYWQLSSNSASSNIKVNIVLYRKNSASGTTEILATSTMVSLSYSLNDTVTARLWVADIGGEAFIFKGDYGGLSSYSSYHYYYYYCVCRSSDGEKEYVLYAYSNASSTVGIGSSNISINTFNPQYYYYVDSSYTLYQFYATALSLEENPSADIDKIRMQPFCLYQATLGRVYPAGLTIYRPMLCYKPDGTDTQAILMCTPAHVTIGGVEYAPISTLFCVRADGATDL